MAELLATWFASAWSPGVAAAADDHKMALDPLSTIVRLYSLVFRPAGTKLFIENHAISFNYPTCYQGVIRYHKQASRHDIRVLKQSIEDFMHMYNLSHPQIAALAQGAVHGLKKFSLCYSKTSNLALHSIEYYMLIISRGLPSPLPGSATGGPAALETGGGTTTHGSSASSASCSLPSTIGASSGPMPASSPIGVISSTASGGSSMSSTGSSTSGGKVSRPIPIPLVPMGGARSGSEKKRQQQQQSSRRNSSDEDEDEGDGDDSSAEPDSGAIVGSLGSDTDEHSIKLKTGGEQKRSPPGASVAVGSVGSAGSAGSGSVGSRRSSPIPILSPHSADEKDKEKDKEREVLLEEFRQMWTPQQINIIHAIFWELEAQRVKENVAEINSLLESVENIVRSKDKRVAEIIERSILSRRPTLDR